MTNTMMKKLLLLFAIATASLAQAQIQDDTTVFDLQTRYGLCASDSKTLVKERYTYAEAVAKYPDAFTAWVREKTTLDSMTTAEADTFCMGFTLFEAAYFDALWKNVGWSSNSGIGRGLCLSRNTIIIPVGTFYTRDQIDYAYGTIRGTSSSSNYEPSGHGGTVIKMWNEEWRGDSLNRVLIGAFHGGADGSNSYSESAWIGNLRIDGGAGDFKDSLITITGLQAWDMGSASEIHNIFVTHCDIGIDVVRGTPCTFTGNNAVFMTNVAAVKITSGGTITFDGTLESDDCPALFLIRGGYGRPSTCNLRVGTIKIEWAITGGRAWKPEVVVDGEGWMNINIGSINYAVGNQFMDALFVLNPNVSTSFLHVGLLEVFAGNNVKALLHDDRAEKTWLYGSGWTSYIKTFDWFSDGTTSQFRSWPTQATAVDAPHQNRLGAIPGDGSTGLPTGEFDRINGTPTWDPEVGSSDPDTTVDTIGGTVLADYTFGSGSTSNIGAATGTNMTQGTVWKRFTSISGGSLNNSNRLATYTVSWTDVTRVRITDLIWSGPLGYQVLMGGSGFSLVVYPDGSVVDSRTRTAIAPKGTVIVGTSVDLDLTIPSSDITYFGGTPGSGSAWQGSMSELEVRTD
jgi:hypothetical protein